MSKSLIVCTLLLIHFQFAVIEFRYDIYFILLTYRLGTAISIPTHTLAATAVNIAQSNINYIFQLSKYNCFTITFPFNDVCLPLLVLMYALYSICQNWHFHSLLSVSFMSHSLHVLSWSLSTQWVYKNIRNERWLRQHYFTPQKPNIFIELFLEKLVLRASLVWHS